MFNVEEPTLIYPDKRKALTRLRYRCLLLGIPMTLLALLLFGQASNQTDGFDIVLRWIMLLEMPVLYLLVSRKLQKQSKPIVALSSQGITINTIGTRVGFLRWNEIGDARAYSFVYRFAGIQLKNPREVYRRLGLARSWLLWTNQLSIPLFKLIRVPVAPINIPQEYLPISADELVAQIEAYRSTYSS